MARCVTNLLISIPTIGISSFLALQSEVAHKAARGAEDKLRKAQGELAHVSHNSTLGELAASISHEVNQPLAAIMTNSEVCLRLLGQEPADTDELRTLMADVIGSSRRASETIQRVRALSKKADLKREPVDVNELLR